MTKSTLKAFVQEKIGAHKFVVVSNREPYIHVRERNIVHWVRPTSGMALALDPVAQALGGVWVAHGSGNADRETVDADGRVKVPPDNPQFHLRRVWLTKEEEQGYYYGFSNEALWPLCHVAYTRPVFREGDWETYKAVNKKFAEAIVLEVGEAPAIVFIQDFHLALVPSMLRERLPRAILAHFWHIPWPNPEAFRICPWKHEILKGLLGNHILGFQIQHHSNNFFDTIEQELEARQDREHFAVVYRGKTTVVRPYPISVDFDELNHSATSPEVTQAMNELIAEHGLTDKLVGIGVDRLDYTKGIAERLRAVDALLNKAPEYRGRFVFLQFAVPSRTHIQAYRNVQDDVENLAEEINWKYQQDNWQPIHLLIGHHQRPIIQAAFRLAHVCVVNSLHDGMNLVAKEFVASRPDERGMLVLSRFCGTAREFRDTALLVNPYAIGATADTIRQALEMPAAEQKRRMKHMRKIVREHNIFRWIGNVVEDLARLA